MRRVLGMLVMWVLVFSVWGQLMGGYSLLYASGADDVTIDKQPPVKRIYEAKPINPHPPVIDGRLDDPIWKKAGWEGNFIQHEPHEGKKPSQRTSFKMLYDDKNLYIGIKAFDDQPDKIVRRMARRDNRDGDWVEVNIDSYHDLRTAFSFGVNAEGVKMDRVISENGNRQDSSWDPVWFVKTNIDNEGWTAEMKIPLNQLRFSSEENQVWGLQVSRQLFRKEENSTWQFIPKDTSGWVHEFGELHGISGIKHKTPIEITPYTVGKLERFEKEEGNPFATGKLQNLVAGLDGKIGLTSDLTLDFTVNPDFGQVEADPSEVNLTAFETFFQEKRPFFIEGRNILNFQIMGGDGGFSSDNLFYSRRIGRRPHHSPDTIDDEYTDVPINTTILGAFKLTGKTKNGLSIGIMESLTAKENAAIDYYGDRRSETVEPMTNYFLVRVQQDFNKGNTILGGMFTSTNRDLKDTGLNYLHKAAYTGGVDFAHRWKNRTYFINFNSVFSHVQGSKEAILETQESSRRYYQRPDANHVSLDPNRTSLSGYGGTLSLGRSGKGHFRFSLGTTWRSPGLELNDMGYLRQADRIMQWSWVQYRIWKPFWILKYMSVNFNQWQGWNFGGRHLFSGGNINGYMQFKNYWSMGFGINLEGKSLSTTALRGGPALKLPGGMGYWLNVNSDNRKPFRFSVGSSGFYDKDNAGVSNRYWFGMTYRPSSRLSVSVHPSMRFRRWELQYVDTLESSGPSIDDSTRYVFAAIDQKTLSVTVRLNYSITPELSIQFYGQPFISAGNYRDFKHITDSKAAQFANRFYTFGADQMSYNSMDSTYLVDENFDGQGNFSFENPNFNFMQFRSNLVLRWEYFPGSTVYLVWSQGRTQTGESGDFRFGRDFRNLFRVTPHDVFLVKFTYRFGLR